MLIYQITTCKRNNKWELFSHNHVICLWELVLFDRAIFTLIKAFDTVKHNRISVLLKLACFVEEKSMILLVIGRPRT